MARFINNNPRIVSTFNPMSFDEISKVPLALATKDELIQNQLDETASKYNMIKVADDERSQRIYNEYGQKLKDQSAELANIIMEKGSLDPRVNTMLRGIKSDYSHMTTAGAIGKLANIRNTIDHQRGALRANASLHGWNDEEYQENFRPSEKDYYDSIDYDRLLNDPNYSPEQFMGVAAPKKETVESYIGRSAGLLGSIRSVRSNTTVEPKESSIGIQMDRTSWEELDSSNRVALDNFLRVINGEIENPDSQLMQSLRYQYRSLSEEERKAIATQEAVNRINMMLRQDSSRDDLYEIDYINTSQGDTSPGPLGPQNTQVDDKNSPGGLASQILNFQDAEEFKDTDLIKRIASGEELINLENMERKLSKLDPNNPLYQNYQKELIEGKNRLLSMKMKIDEDMATNPDKVNESLADFKEILKPVTLRFKNTKGEWVNVKSTDYTNNAKNFQKLRALSVDANNYINRNSKLSEFDDVIGSPISVEEVQEQKLNKNESPNPYYTHKSIKILSKKEIEEKLKNNNINYTAEQLDEYYNMYHTRATGIYISSQISGNFANRYYGDKNTTTSTNSVVYTLDGTGNTKEKYDTTLANMGVSNLITEFRGNDSNFIYNVDGSYQRIKDNKGDSTFEKDLTNLSNGKATFRGVVERAAGKPSTLLIDVKVGEGDASYTKTLGFEISPKGNGSKVDSFGRKLIDNLIDTVGEPHKTLLVSIRDNALYDNVYVDNEAIGVNGMSSHQKNQMSLASKYASDTNYKAVSPILNAEKANIVGHNDGYYSYNYQNKNERGYKTLSVGDFILKDIVKDQIDANRNPKDGSNVRSKEDFLNVDPIANPGKAISVVNKMMVMMYQMVGDTPVIKLPEQTKIEIQGYLDELKKYEAIEPNEVLTQTLNIVKQAYISIHSVPLKHKSKLIGA